MRFWYALQHASNKQLTEDAEKWQKECCCNSFLVVALRVLVLLLFVFSWVTPIGLLSDKFAGNIARLFCKTDEGEIDCVVDIDIAAKNRSSQGCELNYDNNVYELCGMLYNFHICKSNKCENTNRQTPLNSWKVHGKYINQRAGQRPSHEVIDHLWKESLQVIVNSNASTV